MGSNATRSVFAAVLCAGVAMVGASVHGLLGVDAELERSALAAQQQYDRNVHHVSFRSQERGWDCPSPAAEPRTKQRV